MFGNDRGVRAIVIPLARIDNVSADTAGIVLSPPTPMAMLGLAHRIGLDLCGAGILDRKTESVFAAAMVVHEFEVAPGHRRIPPEMRGEAGDASGAMIDAPEAHLLATLVFAVRTEEEATLELVRQFLSDRIRGYRLGGGRIVRSGFMTDRRPGVRKDDAAERLAVEVAWDADAFQEIIRALPPGTVLADRTPLLAEGKEDGDALDRLLDLVALHKEFAEKSPDAPPATDEDSSEAESRKEQTPFRWRRKRAGWLVPVPIGWRALSTVRERPGMRAANDVVGHVWAEDVIGLGEWIPLRKAFGKDGPDPTVFWRYAEADATGPYLVEGGAQL